MPKEKNILLLTVVLLLNCISITAEANEDNILKIKYDSCHNHIIKYGTERPTEALNCARMEIEIGEKIADNVIILNGYIDATRALYLLYQHEMALQYAHKALKLSSDVSNWDLNAEIKRLCGSIYMSLDDDYNAHKYLNEILTYYENKKDTACLIRTLGTMAISLGKNKQYSECIRILTRVYEMSERKKYYSEMVATMINLAIAYDAQDQSDKSIRLLDSIPHIIPSKEISLSNNLSINILVGQLLFKKGEYTRSKKILSKSADDARKWKDYECLIGSLTILVEIAKKENDFKRSSQYYEELVNVMNLINNEEAKRRISEREAIYELSQKNLAIAELTLQNKWNKRQLLLIIIIIITVASIFLIKAKSNAKLITLKTELLSKELEGKRDELTNTAIHYYELRSMVGNLYERIRQVINNCKDDGTKKALLSISTTIANNSALAETKINDYIDANYESFISRLSVIFPDLSDSEKRICAMLLIEFTTKEISNVLNISEKSINNIRSKIRKKMDIPESSSITDYLKKI